MKMRFVLSILIISSFLLSSCRTAFEEVRSSNDPIKILEAANKYYEEEDYLKAQTLYELVVPFYRGKQEAEDVFYKYAYTYYHMEQYILAAHYFNSFTKTFYNSARKEEMAFMSAYSNYLMSPSYKLDQEPTIKAIEELQLFVNTYPSSPRVEECNGLIDEMRYKLETKAYNQGKLYYQLSNFNSAVVAFESMLKDFPESARGEEVRYLIIKSSFELAKNSIYEKMQERLENTIEKIEKFEKKYPNSEYLNEVRTLKENSKNELKRFVNDGYQE